MSSSFLLAASTCCCVCSSFQEEQRAAPNLLELRAGLLGVFKMVEIIPGPFRGPETAPELTGIRIPGPRLDFLARRDVFRQLFVLSLL